MLSSSLKLNNWMPWQRRMLAVLRDLGLDKYNENVPGVAKEGKKQRELKPQEMALTPRAKSRIDSELEILVDDVEMIHISGATIACKGRF